MTLESRQCRSHWKFGFRTPVTFRATTTHTTIQKELKGLSLDGPKYAFQIPIL